MMHNALRHTKPCCPQARIARSRDSLAALALCCVLSACASLHGGERGESDDPLEPLNRAVFDANTALAEAYRTIVPPFVRDRIRSAIDNLAEPRIFVNDLLQRRPDAAGITFARFFLNTTAGLGGMFDLAAGQGLAKQSGDFGQTLYTWGITDGPYVVLLFFGPSNFRDALGLGVDLATTPPAFVVTGHAGTVTSLAVGTVDGIDLRARNIETLDEIKASALDFYAHLKSITRQRRESQLREASRVNQEPQELIDPGTPSNGPTEERPR